jgi:hypothetical protein
MQLPSVRLTDSPKVVAAACLSMILENEPWQDFGFSKRPKYGAFFARFRSKWKIDLENRILQEMLAVFTVAYVVADRLTIDDIPNVISVYLQNTDIVKALVYASREDGVEHLTRSIINYRELPLREWQGPMWERIGSIPMLDRKRSARLLLGCIRFRQNVETMVLFLRDKQK